MIYKFDDIAYNVTTKRVPTPDDNARYIGLEHLDPGELYVKRYGSNVDLKGDKLVMTKGDILFGKRNTYLKRVAIAPFDGLFSAHGMIFHPKEEVIDKRYFPFFINSCAFMDGAIRISVGSLSPTVNWKDLKDLKFDIPPIEKQKQLADKLWIAYDLKSKYANLVESIDEMVKSQFIEMFGTCNDPKAAVETLGSICDVQRGGSPRPISDYITDDPEGLNWIKIGDTDDSMYITCTEEKIKSSGLRKTRQVHAGDLLLSNSMSFGRPYILAIDGCIHDGWLVLHFDQNKIHPVYLCSYLSQATTYCELSKLAAGGVVNNLNKEIVKVLPTLVPKIDSQKQFVNIVEQADK